MSSSQSDTPSRATPSRRKFLQGAAVAAASAAAATAAGAVVASTAHTSLNHAIQTFGSNHGVVSGCTTAASMCIEAGFHSKSPLHAYQPITTFNVVSGSHGSFATMPSEFFLWFTGTNVPAGTYAIALTLDPSFSMIHDSEEPSGIEVDVFIEKPCTAKPCPASEELGHEHHFSSLAGLSHITLSSASDVQVKIYLKYTGAKPTNGQTFTFSGSLTGGSVTINASATLTASV